jgi:hypothetical protein
MRVAFPVYLYVYSIFKFNLSYYKALYRGLSSSYLAVMTVYCALLNPTVLMLSALLPSAIQFSGFPLPVLWSSFKITDSGEYV